MEKEFFSYLKDTFNAHVAHRLITCLKLLMEAEELGWFSLARELGRVMNCYSGCGPVRYHGRFCQEECLEVLEVYEDFLRSEAADPVLDADSELNRLLNRIGKAIFVKYYSTFATLDTDACKAALASEGFTEKAINARTFSAIRIFRKGKERAALQSIADSGRVDEDTRRKAQELLDGAEAV